MKHAVLTLSLISLMIISVQGQSRAELEALRKKNLEEIEYVDKMVKATATQKQENLSQIRVISKKLSLREKIINEYGQEIDLIEYRISLNRTAEEIMEEDLERMRREYERSIINAYKATKGTPALAFILSSSDFNQGYKRLKYIQQVARYRRNEAELINNVYSELQTTRERLENDKKSLSDLRHREERQKQILKEEQIRKERMVNSLSKKEKQLKQDLEEKKKITKKIELEIEKLIEEERKRSLTKPLSAEMKLVGESFGENKGRLPWPVEKGVITSHFGLQPHPVLKNVTEDNIGVEISSVGKTKAKAVFKGQVVRVFSISGANMAVIIRHGKYLTVYQNLVNVAVKPGEDVNTGEIIGDVFIEDGDDEKAILKFMIYEEKIKLDPEIWIVKR